MSRHEAGAPGGGDSVRVIAIDNEAGGLHPSRLDSLPNRPLPIEKKEIDPSGMFWGLGYRNASLAFLYVALISN